MSENLKADVDEQIDERKTQLMFANPQMYHEVFENQRKSLEASVMEEMDRRRSIGLAVRTEREEAIQKLLAERHGESMDGLSDSDDVVGPIDENWKELLSKGR